MKKVFRNENLDYLDFSNYCLLGVKFYNCSLRFCKFFGSDLSHALFDNCDLYCANFDNSVMYVTRFESCDITKSELENSYLNGIRIKDTVVTYANFGTLFKTANERKSTVKDLITDSYYISKVGPLPAEAVEIENNYQGIFCSTTNVAINFIKENAEKRRVFRRQSEIARSIKNVLEENGDNDKSLKYYFFHRRFLRKSFKNWFKRLNDFLWGELFWGYGVKIYNPVIAFFINCLVFSILYSITPIFFDNAGIEVNSEILSVFECGEINWLNYFEILYNSLLISALSVFGKVDVVGFAKLLVVFHVLISVLSLGLGITALTKRMSNI